MLNPNIYRIVRTGSAAILTFLAVVTLEAKPRIRILATGGTIAGAQLDPTNAAYRSGAVSIQSLLVSIPHISDVADVSSEQIADIGSQDMSDQVWLLLAHRIESLLASPEVDGIVITHGTDTMEETAYFLELVNYSEKPVVLTGAMRPATSISADGPLNIYNAIAVAADPQSRNRGVLVVMDDKIHAAAEVTKTSTIYVEAFQSPNRGLLGFVHLGKSTYFRPSREGLPSSDRFLVHGRESLPRVDIVYAYAGMDRAMIDAAIQSGAQGIVVAGVGDGNMTRVSIEALRDAVKRGVVAVRSTRVMEGVVFRNVEINDDQFGFVAAKGLNPQKARVLLKLALTRTRNATTIQQWFDRDW